MRGEINVAVRALTKPRWQCRLRGGGIEHATAAKGNGIPRAERKHHDRKRSVLIIVVGSASGQGAGEGNMTAMEEGRRG